MTLHNQGRNRAPPSFDSVNVQDRSMYGDNVMYGDVMFAARDSTLDRPRAEPGHRRHEREAAPRSGKVQGRASISPFFYEISVTSTGSKDKLAKQ